MDLRCLRARLESLRDSQEFHLLARSVSRLRVPGKRFLSHGKCLFVFPPRKRRTHSNGFSKTEERKFANSSVESTNVLCASRRRVGNRSRFTISSISVVCGHPRRSLCRAELEMFSTVFLRRAAVIGSISPALRAQFYPQNWSSVAGHHLDDWSKARARRVWKWFVIGERGWRTLFLPSWADRNNGLAHFRDTVACLSGNRR